MWWICTDAKLQYVFLSLFNRTAGENMRRKFMGWDKDRDKRPPVTITGKADAA